jgi:hypothetical protein
MGYSLVGPGSTRAESAASDSLDPPSAFRAKRLPDGRVLVEDVPVFCETEARYTPDGKLYAPPIGLPWLKGAFEAFQRNPGYWAPLHGDHHTGGLLEGVKDRERFGEFRARSLRLMRVDGQLRWTFTADYLFDDEEKAKRSNRFPYQSVEIVNEKPSEINSVALLSDKAPFVRFPNRRVAFQAGDRVAYAAGGNLAAFVSASPFKQYTPAAFAAEEDLMEDENKPEGDKPIEAAAAPAAPAPVEKPAAEAFDAKGEIDGLKKGMAEMGAMLQKVCSAMSLNAEAAEEPAAPAPEEKKTAVAPVVAAAAGTAPADAAEIDTLRARIESMERGQKQASLFATLSSRLEPFGLTTGRKQRLEEFLKNDLLYGTSFAEQYVKDTEAREKRVSRPATERGPSAASEQATGDLPTELRAYAAMGVTEASHARALLTEFRALEAHGCAGDMTLAAFVKQRAVAAPGSN